MSTNLDYLDPALQPLADKLQAYLQTEKELQRAEVKATDLTHRNQPAPHPTDYEQRSAAGSYNQSHEEIRLSLQHLREEVDRLRQEIITLLPVRDEWIKVNLGYGPSRVGAFSTTSADAPAGYELRVVV